MSKAENDGLKREIRVLRNIMADSQIIAGAEIAELKAQLINSEEKMLEYKAKYFSMIKNIKI